MQIHLGDGVYQLWFNNYAVAELQKTFGVEQDQVIAKVSEMISQNYLLLIRTLVEVGIKGHAMAKDEVIPDISNLSELIAEADMAELLQVWEVFFEHIGGNVPAEKKDQKKKAVTPQGKRS